MINRETITDDVVKRLCVPRVRSVMITDAEHRPFKLLAHVSGVGTFYWYAKFKGRPVKARIGRAGTFSVADARERARSLTKLTLHGRDPRSCEKNANAPSEINEIFGLTRLQDCKPIIGLYYLCLKGKVQYVGQSIDVVIRVRGHLKRIPYDSVFYAPVSASELDCHERKEIDRLDPPFNTDSITRARRRRSNCQ